MIGLWQMAVVVSWETAETIRWSITSLQISAALSLLMGGAASDTLILQFTRAQWMDPQVQADIAQAVSNLQGGSDLTFNAFGLTASNIETLRVFVDGVELTPEDDAVLAQDDVVVTSGEHEVVIGNVLDNDDAPDLVKSVDLVTGPDLGTLVLNADGTYTYDPGNAFDSLAEGETTTQSFSYRVTDADGDSNEATVTIMITGTNDAPVISGVASGAVQEDGLTVISGQLIATDVDNGATATWAAANNGAGEYGTLTVDSAGQWTYQLANASAGVQALAAGEVVTDTITVVVTDDQGATSTQDVTVTITGTNDAPVIVGQAEGAVQEDQVTTVSGQLGASDVDNGATATWSVVNPQGGYGALSIDQSGQWTYLLDNAAPQVQALAAGQRVAEAFTVEVMDEQGAIASQAINITVAGSGDGPVIFPSSLVTEPQPLGNEFRIHSHGLSSQSGIGASSVSALGGGGFVVVWDDPMFDVYGQVFDSNGIRVGNEFEVNTYNISNQRAPSVAALHDGGFVVTWNSYGQDGSAEGVYGQKFLADGSKDGDEFQINTYSIGPQGSGVVTALNDGGFLVSWESSDGNGPGIYAKRYYADGSDSGEFQVNTYTTSTQYWSKNTALDDGGFIITWTSYGQEGSAGIYGQRFAADGTALGSEFHINTYTSYTQETASITSLNDGGFVVTWMSLYQDGRYGGIYAQRFETDAGSVSKVGSEFRVNSYTASDQRVPDVTALNDGGFVITWTSDGQDGSGYGIFGQRYDAQGVAVGGGQINSSIAGFQMYPSIDVLENGDLIVTWSSQVGSGYGVYGQIFSVGANLNQPVVEDQVLRSSGQFSAADNEGSLLTWGVVDPKGNYGAISINESGFWTYELDNGSASVQALTANDVVKESFAIQATNAQGATVTQDVEVEIRGSNDAPELQLTQILTATPQPDGQEFRVNTATALDQTQPAIAATADGGYIIVWDSYQAYYSRYTGIYGQRYDAEGNRVGSEFRIAGTNANTPAIAELQNGDLVVTWQGLGDDGDIYGRLLHADGSQDAIFKVNEYTTSSQSRSDVTALDNGGFVVVWVSQGQDGSEAGVYGRLYDANGLAMAEEFQVNSKALYYQDLPSITSLADGDFLVTWAHNGDHYEIFGQRYSRDGIPEGDEFQINTVARGMQNQPDITALPDGGFVVTWLSPDANGYGIVGQVFDAYGAKVGAQFSINSYSINQQSSPEVAALQDGGFVATWWSLNQDDSTYGYGVFGQRFDADGAKVGVEFQINSYSIGQQFYQSIATLADGSIVVTWASEGQDGSGYGIYAQHFSLPPIQVTYTEGDAPVQLVADLTISDIDGTLLESAVVSLSQGFVAGEDQLAVVTDGTAIAATYDVATGVLTLTGSDTLANYQHVLQSLSYWNTSVSPDETQRTISIVVNDGFDESAAITRMINVVDNDAPAITVNDFLVIEGATVTVTPDMLAANDVDGDAVSFEVQNVIGGHFALNSATATSISSFTAEQIADGYIVFVDDGDKIAPSFEVVASDGITRSAAVAGQIDFVSVKVMPTGVETVTEFTAIDPAAISAEGAIGIDSLSLQFDGSVDLTDIVGFVSNIEQLDLTQGAVAVSDALTLSDILQITDADSQLAIFGGADDSLVLDTDWQQAGTVDLNGHDMNVYSDSTHMATLLIENTINIVI